jgi:sulfite exporter TauE/SafE/copper chaperone CopZ
MMNKPGFFKRRSFLSAQPEQEVISQPPQKAVFRVQGIHCASCVVRIERKLKQIEGVQKVEVDGTVGKVELVCTCIPPLEQLHQAVQTDGYAILVWEDEKGPSTASVDKNTPRDYLEIGLIALACVGLFLILSRWSFIPKGIGVSDNMGYGIVFVFGLIASVSSCAAATGGLLIGMTTVYHERQADSGSLNKMRPALLFNLGRILSYTFFGAVIGSLGSVFTLSPQLNGSIALVAALFMLLLGIQLLKLFPWMRRFQPRMPKFIAHKVYDASGKPSHMAFFLVGAGTFFLPCGFTQALQLYVLGRGNAVAGALTMLIFSLGTFPTLLSFGAISSLFTGGVQRYVVKVSGVLVLLIGLLNFSSGLTIAGIALPASAASSPSQSVQVAKSHEVSIINGKQIVSMKVVGFTYTPSVFTIVAGVPVEWHVDGSQAEGCADVLTVPDLGMSVVLPAQGSKTIDFVPHRSGILSFRCPMAMTTTGAHFTVLPHIQTINANPQRAHGTFW